MQEIITRAKQLLNDGTVKRVLAYTAGDFSFNPEPCFFNTESELDGLVYNEFCGANLSKYLIEAVKLEGKTLVLLKPCDSYSFNQLLKEHRVVREKVYIIGVFCNGNVDVDTVRKTGAKGIEELSVALQNDKKVVNVKTLYGDKTLPLSDVLLERCKVCKGKEHKVFDEIFGVSEDTKEIERFSCVADIEALTSKERYEYFQKELGKCIRCNACRNICPACSCRKCVFDSNKFDSEARVNADEFEEKFFHIIRAYHVAGRCTDCGECSRACPEGIQLHLFNRKLIKDIGNLYGEFAAGEDIDTLGPLTDYKQSDSEPGAMAERG